MKHPENRALQHFSTPGGLRLSAFRLFDWCG
jgi:hypothetical protein